ncbi:hypothetical protein CAPTEDRAFT_205910 [Capitella teleta]|uniref:Uncharacterized protein n=1 Tax=Capitella teleta TaxID=283909 RepID=R7TC27_CAPTE|nr:hypothetical protein CAPTEDRAFT_205910 [Capitella teleta]|eukprot:ELT89047.1 hypothetical protein CAPTEDRAFT_205910 [Capitella teleta]
MEFLLGERGEGKIAFVVRVLEENGLVARVWRACLMEIGVRSKWWKKIGRMMEKLGVDVSSNLVWLRRMSAIGVAEMGICEDERKRMMKVELERRVQEVGRMRWEEQLQRNERTRRYTQEKGEMKLEPYADGQEGAGVRLMMRVSSKLVLMLMLLYNLLLHWSFYVEGYQAASSRTMNK